MDSVEAPCKPNPRCRCSLNSSKTSASRTTSQPNFSRCQVTPWQDSLRLHSVFSQNQAPSPSRWYSRSMTTLDSHNRIRCQVSLVSPSRTKLKTSLVSHNRIKRQVSLASPSKCRLRAFSASPSNSPSRCRHRASLASPNKTRHQAFSASPNKCRLKASLASPNSSSSSPSSRPRTHPPSKISSLKTTPSTSDRRS